MPRVFKPNKAQQFAADGRRTPLCSALKAWLQCSWVWCLVSVPVFGLASKQPPGSAKVLAALSVFRSRGNPAHSLVSFRSFGVLVPGAMGQPGARYREWAFSIGCQNK